MHELSSQNSKLCGIGKKIEYHERDEIEKLFSSDELSRTSDWFAVHVLLFLVIFILGLQTVYPLFQLHLGRVVLTKKTSKPGTTCSTHS